jgi:hypothetical protein
MPEPIFMKLGMYIMPPEPISAAYFSLCVYTCTPPIVARQRFGKDVPVAPKDCWRCRFLFGPRLWKERRRSVLRTSCYVFLLKNRYV